MCYELAQRFGVRVTACAPYPFYPEWKDKSGKNGFRVWQYDDQGVCVRRYGMYIPKRPTALLERILFEGTLLLSMFRAVPLARHHDVVMIYLPPAACLVIGWMMQRFFRKPVWLNIQDFAGDAAQATGIVRGSWLKRPFGLLRALERRLIASFPVCSTISPVMAEKLARVRGSGVVHIVPNWTARPIVEALDNVDIPQGKIQRRACSNGGAIELLYAGNIGAKQDLLVFCKFLAATDVPFRFRIFGAGGCASEVEHFVREARDHRFSFGPMLGFADYAAVLKSADLYVITEKDGIDASFFPSKAVVSMSAGLPILAVCSEKSPLGTEIREHDVGFQAEWQTMSKIIEVLREPAQGERRDRLQAWRSAALKRATAYDRDRIVYQIHKILVSMFVEHSESCRRRLC
jgi:glycosyltransferase involved in cell wall biosynthesis